MTIQSIIEEIVARRAYVYAVVANSEGEVLFEVGDVSRLEWKGMLTNLFGDADAIKNVSTFLEGQTTPRLQKQGHTQCILLKPRHNIIVGLFDESKRATMEIFTEAKEVLHQLRTRLPTVEER